MRGEQCCEAQSRRAEIKLPNGAEVEIKLPPGGGAEITNCGSGAFLFTKKKSLLVKKFFLIVTIFILFLRSKRFLRSLFSVGSFSLLGNLL
jgi:hypothetical protein